MNIDNPYFEGMIDKHIYPPELQLNIANNTNTEAPFLDSHLPTANGFVSSKIYDKRDDFDFDKVNFPFLDGDVPRRASLNGVYISQLIRFARVCNHVADFNARNKCLPVHHPQCRLYFYLGPLRSVKIFRVFKTFKFRNILLTNV